APRAAPRAARPDRPDRGSAAGSTRWPGGLGPCRLGPGGSTDELVALYRADPHPSRNDRRQGSGRAGPVLSTSFSPDGRVLVTSGIDGSGWPGRGGEGALLR